MSADAGTGFAAIESSAGAEVPRAELAEAEQIILGMLAAMTAALKLAVPARLAPSAYSARA